MVGLAVERVWQDYVGTPDPAGLLAESLTLKDLRDLHEAVAGGRLGGIPLGVRWSRS